MTFEIQTKSTSKVENVYHNMRCDGCDSLLKNSHRHALDGSDEYVCNGALQPDDALILKLEGGYGCAIDPCCDTSKNQLFIKMFCKTCLKKLCEQWPTFQKTVETECSSSIGHNCSKLRKFVWEQPCCYGYCEGCGRKESYTIGLEIDNDIFSRRIIKCFDCGLTAPGIWNWEITNYFWTVQKWNDKLKKNEILQKFNSEVEAKSFLKDWFQKNLEVEEDEVRVEKLACVEKKKKMILSERKMLRLARLGLIGFDKQHVLDCFVRQGIEKEIVIQIIEKAIINYFNDGNSSFVEK